MKNLLHVVFQHLDEFENIACSATFAVDNIQQTPKHATDSLTRSVVSDSPPPPLCHKKREIVFSILFVCCVLITGDVEDYEQLFFMITSTSSTLQN